MNAQASQGRSIPQTSSDRQMTRSTASQVKKNSTPEIWQKKFPPLNQCDDEECVIVSMPVGGFDRLQSACSTLSAMKLAGLAMVASLLWESRHTDRDGRIIMRIVKAAALCFVDRIGECSNPASFVARAWGCEQFTRGRNINGKVANTWLLPSWADGETEQINLRLTPRQLRCWNRRYKILSGCLDKANPHAGVVRKNLALTKPGPSFDDVAHKLRKKGEQESVKSYREKPLNLNVTCDGDVQSNVSRLPEIMRAALQIDGLPVAELDVKSAHAVLLGIFYTDETNEDWRKEKIYFNAESRNGFPSIYGTGKACKVGFLSALNQSGRVARHSSKGYLELERLFPLLGKKLAGLKAGRSKCTT